jgi:hypothetical protein
MAADEASHAIASPSKKAIVEGEMSTAHRAAIKNAMGSLALMLITMLEAEKE